MPTAMRKTMHLNFNADGDFTESGGETDNPVSNLSETDIHAIAARVAVQIAPVGNVTGNVETVQVSDIMPI